MLITDIISGTTKELSAYVAGDVLHVCCGWTVPINRAQAVAYARANYNEGQPDGQGFYNHDPKIGLHHGDLRILLELNEANAIVDLIKAAFPEANVSAPRRANSPRIQASTPESAEVPDNTWRRLKRLFKRAK